MKKLTLALMAVAAGLFGPGATSNAYSPGAGGVTARPAVVSAGGAVTVSATCAAGETVTASLVSAASSAVCGAERAVEIMIAAPAVAGYFEGPVTGSANGVLGSFTVTVPVAATQPGLLPAPGTNGSTAMTLALGVFVVGVGLFGLSRLRSRKSPDQLTH
ncbi:MAG: hypothetical protein ACI9N0_003461 [Ilumatobacter sp.]|jgi:hypothetical protein